MKTAGEILAEALKAGRQPDREEMRKAMRRQMPGVEIQDTPRRRLIILGVADQLAEDAEDLGRP